MSSRFNKAVSAGRVILINEGPVSVSITLFKTEKKNGRTVVKSKKVHTVSPGRETKLSRKYTTDDLRFSLTEGNLKRVLATRNIRVVDTWSD